MEAVIEAHNLTKSFKAGVVAVSGLDLRVGRGAVYGLIGRNGAGKTTTLRLLMGLLRPDTGTAKVLGSDLWSAPRELRQRVAYVSQNQQLPGWMTLTELVCYLGHFYTAWDGAFARELARRWELPWQQPIAQLSGGQQRQAAILLALAARPEVLLLDEPAAGLDPIARRALLSELVEVMTRADGCTVLFSTHLIGDLERVAEFVGIMHRGRITTTARLEDLLQTTKRVQVVFDRSLPPRDFAIPGALRSQTAGPVVTAIIRLASEEQLAPIRQMPGVRVNIFPVGLEELFIKWFGRGTLEESKERDFSPESEFFLNQNHDI